MKIDDDLLEEIAEVLSAVYRRVRWHRMGNSNPHDVFQHRLKYAAYRGTVYECVDKLCQGLGIQSLKVPADRLASLQARAREVLHALRHESIYLVALATEKARVYKERLKAAREQEKLARGNETLTFKSRSNNSKIVNEDLKDEG